MSENSKALERHRAHTKDYMDSEISPNEMNGMRSINGKGIDREGNATGNHFGETGLDFTSAEKQLASKQ